MACTHERLVKVIDQMGVMTIGPDGQYRAPILQAHYECEDCGAVTGHTEAPRSAWTDFDFHGAVAKIGTALTAVDEARRAIRRASSRSPQEEA